MPISEQWTAKQLMGEPAAEASPDPMLWGVPGHLTESETAVYFQFREHVQTNPSVQSTVYCFGEEEGEVWALCRWLRARKYVLEDVIQMVTEAKETRQAAEEHDFYPNPVDALGVDASLFFAQYPQLYSGFAKNGAPLFISKPGILNVDGMGCITTLDGIIQFHWHIMMHDFAQRLRKQKAADPNFTRFDCFCVLDLAHLTLGQLSKRALAIIKEQAAIDSICFPETMSKMLIINSPSFFPPTWRLIKGWLDPRTAGKIEVLSGKSAGEQRLLELIERDQLPSDYGGNGPDTNKTIMDEFGGDADRMETRMLYLRGHGSEVVQVQAGESVRIVVYTRSTSGASITLHDNDQKTELGDPITVQHTTELGDRPCEQSLTPTASIPGPVSIKVKANSNASRFSSHQYLLVFSFQNNQ